MLEYATLCTQCQESTQSSDASTLELADSHTWTMLPLFKINNDMVSKWFCWAMWIRNCYYCWSWANALWYPFWKKIANRIVNTHGNKIGIPVHGCIHAHTKSVVLCSFLYTCVNLWWHFYTLLLQLQLSLSSIALDSFVIHMENFQYFYPTSTKNWNCF